MKSPFFFSFFFVTNIIFVLLLLLCYITKMYGQYFNIGQSVRRANNWLLFKVNWRYNYILLAASFFFFLFSIRTIKQMEHEQKRAVLWKKNFFLVLLLLCDFYCKNFLTSDFHHFYNSFLFSNGIFAFYWKKFAHKEIFYRLLLFSEHCVWHIFLSNKCCELAII